MRLAVAAAVCWLGSLAWCAWCVVLCCCGAAAVLCCGGVLVAAVLLRCCCRGVPLSVLLWCCAVAAAVLLWCCGGCGAAVLCYCCGGTVLWCCGAAVVLPWCCAVVLCCGAGCGGAGCGGARLRYATGVLLAVVVATAVAVVAVVAAACGCCYWAPPLLSNSQALSGAWLLLRYGLHFFCAYALSRSVRFFNCLISACCESFPSTGSQPRPDSFPFL